MAEGRMELFIETLTGTAFELSCSPQETIVSIKAKIQHSEGIPVLQQHLIWKSQELSDDLCLQDYSIRDGATLKLVLGMRGGPINTRQVSNSRKLKDLAEYVERTSLETAESGGRPLTVLVFHDGDKVHMYTLLEKEDCTISPLSGTISETSSVASIKNLEELDQEVKENEITREKIAQLQEQLRSLQLTKPKKLSSTAAQASPLFLPPLQRVDAIDSHPCADANAQSTAKALKGISSSLHMQHKVPSREVRSPAPRNRASTTTLDFISSNLSSFVLDSNESAGSSFLPYLSTAQGATRRASYQKRAQDGSVDMAINTIVKYDPSSMKKCPGTTSQVLPTRRFIDLDEWLHTRPQTSPEKTAKSAKANPQSRRRLRRESSLSFYKGSSSLLVRMLNEDAPFNLPVTMANGDDKKEENRTSVGGSVLTKEEKTVKQLLVQESKMETSAQSSELPSRSNEEPSRALSAKKLPIIKAKKKTYKRCSLCSKKTGLATSYTCRCGKNFCASHRYAELHHCSYDYKTEGRRLLQINNPVITASKLPKI